MKRGRPKLDDDVVLSVRVTVMVTKDEAKAFTRAAKSHGKSVSGYLREMMVARVANVLQRQRMGEA